MENKVSELFSRPLVVANVGLDGFAKDIAAQKAGCVHVEWRPPAGGNAQLIDILSKLR